MRRSLKLDAVFDIETEDWTTFVMGGIRTKEGTETYDNADALLDSLLTIEGRVWAHNLGRFDGLWLLDLLHKRGLKVDIVNAASRVISCKVGATEFCDSLALVPMSLAEWTCSKETTGLPCRCASGCGCSKGCLSGAGCGGYCSISRRMGRDARATLRRYLVNDLEILWKGMRDLEVFAKEHDLDLGLTIGGSSWSTVHRVLELPKADWRGTASTRVWKGLTYEGIRDGYFGGRCQAFRPAMGRGWLADINSLYPAQLARVPMPVGRARDTPSPAKDFEGGRAGVFLADVRVPEMLLPPLPVRVRDGNGTARVAYPVGKFRGVWTGLELRWALDHGATLRGIHRAITWERTEVLFDTWIDRLFKLRATAGKKTPIGKWLKLYMNSLTGKFAMRPARARYQLHPAEEDIKPWDRERCKKHCRNEKALPSKCRGNCGAHIEVSPGVYKAQSYFVNPCAHVEFAAHLTAGGRTTLGDALSAHGIGVANCDTDSVFSIHRSKNLGGNLGQLADLGPIRNFRLLAPKCYTYEKYAGPPRDWDSDVPPWNDDSFWVPEFAAKGISNPETKWQRIEGGETVESHRIRGFVTGAKKGSFFERDEIRRTVKLAIARHGAYGDRVLDGEVTRPRDISEFKVLR